LPPLWGGRARAGQDCVVGGVVAFCYPFATQIKTKYYLCKQGKTKAKKNMALKKDHRSDNTYMISTDTGDNPKLGAKLLSDGKESLFLDYYFGYTKKVSQKTGKEFVKADRKREYLKLYLWQAPRTPIERQQNKETLELGKEAYLMKQEALNDLLKWFDDLQSPKKANEAKKTLEEGGKYWQDFILKLAALTITDEELKNSETKNK